MNIFYTNNLRQNIFNNTGKNVYTRKIMVFNINSYLVHKIKHVIF